MFNIVKKRCVTIHISFFIVLKLRYEGFFKPVVSDYQVVKNVLWIINIVKKECSKAGKNSAGKQKYYCGCCKKYQQKIYVYKAYDINIDEQIVQYVKNSCGIRSIGRLLNISNTTVLKRIRLIASGLVSTYASSKGCVYEMDELHTFAGNKKQDQWLIYAINKGTRSVVDIFVGRRNKENIKKGC